MTLLKSCSTERYILNREIKVNAVPKSTQNATKYGVRLFKGKSTSSASLTILF